MKRKEKVLNARDDDRALRLHPRQKNLLRGRLEPCRDIVHRLINWSARFGGQRALCPLASCILIEMDEKSAFSSELLDSQEGDGDVKEGIGCGVTGFNWLDRGCRAGYE